MPRDRRLSRLQSSFIEGARNLGKTTALPVLLSDEELARIASVVFKDIGRIDLVPPGLREVLAKVDSYYDLDLDWFQAEDRAGGDYVALYLAGIGAAADFETYFGCLCNLHKRRKKYATILTAQPLPTMLQVAPRSLLEFGTRESEALSSWLTWRKWFFDIDNRAGQETGYLFEPILCAALGGKSFSPKRSPVKRLTDGDKGRQVDCVVDKTAYEFKLRVTIAASGQGRFGEELAFAADCQGSGFVPVLMVLDPTPSARLDDLTREFQRYGGRAYIGDEAWRHLEDEAGATMATFVEKYVRLPIEAMDAHADELLTLSISSEDRGRFQVCLKNQDKRFEWSIPRHEDPSLASDDEDTQEPGQEGS